MSSTRLNFSYDPSVWFGISCVELIAATLPSKQIDGMTFRITIVTGLNSVKLL